MPRFASSPSGVIIPPHPRHPPAPIEPKAWGGKIGITICYGNVYDFTLLHTKFGFGVSWKKFVQPCGVDNRRGVIPDLIVESSFSEESKGEDTVLEFAVELARKIGLRRGSPMF